MPVETAIVDQDFSKGANVATSPWGVGKQQAVLITNMLLDEHGAVRTRDGTLIQTTSAGVGASGAILTVIVATP